MRVLYLPCHSVLEYDELRILSSIGHEVASLGAYIDPAHPLEQLRPPLDIPMVPLVKREVDALGQQGFTDTLDAAKRHIPDAILEWAEVIIVAGFEHTWLVPQWQRLRSKRVIWRTIGQSGDHNEAMMRPVREDGCQIVRYSPKERHIPGYVGEDALIRFGKDPADWSGWAGEDAVVTNVTQALARRNVWCGYPYWQSATFGLPTLPLGGESEAIGGPGNLPPDELLARMLRCRAYLYTGTQPASYTLGMIEAMLTGIPMVSIGPQWQTILPYGPHLFEAHEIIGVWFNDPQMARAKLIEWLEHPGEAARVGALQRQRAIEMFGVERIAEQWRAFLVEAPVRELVAA